MLLNYVAWGDESQVTKIMNNFGVTTVTVKYFSNIVSGGWMLSKLNHKNKTWLTYLMYMQCVKYGVFNEWLQTSAELMCKIFV